MTGGRFEPEGREFDNLAAGQVGRRSKATAVPKGRGAEGPEAISPGAPVNQILTADRTARVFAE